MTFFLTAFRFSAEAYGLPAFIDQVLSVFTKGTLCGALFYVVMLAGALPDRDALRKKVIPCRKQLSILAGFLAMGHGFGYGYRYFPLLLEGMEELRLSVFWACLCSLLLLCLLMPLWVTSFLFIRRKMNPKTWKNIQRAAYVFYALIYLHILLFRFHAVQTGQRDAAISIILYTILFCLYGALRLNRMAVRTQKEYLLLPVQLITICLVALVTGYCVCSVSSASQGKQGQTQGSVAADVSAEKEEGALDVPGEAEAGLSAEESGMQGSFEQEGSSEKEGSAQGSSEKDGFVQGSSGKEGSVQGSSEKDGLGQGSSEKESSAQASSPAGGTSATPAWQDGTYQGSALGYNGKLKVSVTVEDGRITDLTLKSHVEDEPYVSRAVKGVFAAILENNQPEADAVSTATTTSEALVLAVQNALSKSIGQ